MPNGPVDRDGRLQFGDELVAVNGVSLESVKHQDAVDVLRACAGTVRLKVIRVPGSNPNGNNGSASYQPQNGEVRGGDVVGETGRMKTRVLILAPGMCF